MVSSDTKSSTVITNGVDTVKDGSETVPDIVGGSVGGGEGKNEGGESESSDESGKKKMGMSLSQTLTMGYAALVGGFIIYLFISSSYYYCHLFVVND